MLDQLDSFEAKVQDALVLIAQCLLDLRRDIAISTGTLQKALQAKAADAEAQMWRGLVSWAVVFEQTTCPVVSLRDGWYLLRPNKDGTVSITRLDRTTQ